MTTNEHTDWFANELLTHPSYQQLKDRGVITAPEVVNEAPLIVDSWNLGMMITLTETAKAEFMKLYAEFRSQGVRRGVARKLAKKAFIAAKLRR